MRALPGPALRRWLEAGGRWLGFAAGREWQGGKPGEGEEMDHWRPGPTSLQRPCGPAGAWITSLGPLRQDRVRRSAFVAQRLHPGAMDVRSIGALAQPDQPGDNLWAHPCSRSPDSASRPAWSLAGDGRLWFVGLGHPNARMVSTPLVGCSGKEARRASRAGSLLAIACIRPWPHRKA